MSARSMTGHGRASAQGGGLRVEVDVASVNRKQLDVALSISRALAPLEAPIQEMIAGVLSRGRVTVTVSVRPTAGHARSAVKLDEPLARGYLDALRKGAKRLGVRDDLSLSHVVALPGVVHVSSTEDEPGAVWSLLKVALAKALAQLDRMRSREGAALARDLLARMNRLAELNREIMAHSPAAVARYREALLRRIAAIQADTGLSAERLEREVILFADRSDITEETTRITSHLAQARGLLRAAEPAGKSLDFLAQELSREINTIGSKAADAEIARRVVLFKTELDRLREQVQNIQ